MPWSGHVFSLHTLFFQRKLTADVFHWNKGPNRETEKQPRYKKSSVPLDGNCASTPEDKLAERTDEKGSGFDQWFMHVQIENWHH